MRNIYSKDIDEHMEGRSVQLAGWIEDIRHLGSITFIIIRDFRGSFQATVKGEIAKEVSTLPRQSFVSVVGVINKGYSESYPYELVVEKIQTLNRSSNVLPLDPTGRTKADMITMINNRPLSLRIPQERNTFLARSILIQSSRRFLIERGFVEVDTPKIISTSSEGGADLFKVDYFGEKAFLAQSPQLFKEELVLGLDRVFEIAHYFRAERSNTVKHLSEFMSLDVEATLLSKEDVMDLLEDMIQTVYEELKSDKLANISLDEVEQFERFTYNDVVNYLSAAGYKVEFGDDLTSERLHEFGRNHDRFYFITNWPLSLKPFYTMPSSDPQLSESFDLMFGDLEISSGSQRIHNSTLLRKRLVDNGLNPSDFEYHLKTFDWGMPPHSGFGVGIDRLLMRLMGRNNIREVVLYPRDVKRLTP